MDRQIIYQIALSRMKGMSVQLVGHLIDQLGSVEAIFEEDEKALMALVGVKTALFSTQSRNTALNFAEKEAGFLLRNAIQPLFYTDESYPVRLRDCSDAPLLLYYRGNGNLNSLKVVSVVGTRHATPYGIGFCETFIREISVSFPDVLIVSGLAYGVDVAAHRFALREHLNTIGVLAHGLNTLYPGAHRSTAAAMLNQGGLLTEYSSEGPIYRGNFIARNRIVAGMSDATIVVESADKGGALITAGLASGYNRDVFALPGRIGDRFSVGCNRLISTNRAALITCADEFAEAMLWVSRQRQAPVQKTLFPPDLEEDEALVFDLLVKQGEGHINQLTIQTDFPASKIMALLLELEFKGLIRAFPGGLYRPL